VKGFYSLLQLGLCCSFLLNLLLHELNSFHNHPSPDHLLLYQAKEFAFLTKACQLVFNDNFDLFLEILLLVFKGFGLLVWVLIVELVLP
jgi:hypothetical protein